MSKEQWLNEFYHDMESAATLIDSVPISNPELKTTKSAYFTLARWKEMLSELGKDKNGLDFYFPKSNNDTTVEFYIITFPKTKTITFYFMDRSLVDIQARAGFFYDMEALATCEPYESCAYDTLAEYLGYK